MLQCGIFRLALCCSKDTFPFHMGCVEALNNRKVRKHNVGNSLSPNLLIMPNLHHFTPMIVQVAKELTKILFSLSWRNLLLLTLLPLLYNQYFL